MTVFRYKFEYNDSCNCHPETREVVVEAPTVEELAAKVAAEVASIGSRAPDIETSEVVEVRALTPEEAQRFDDAYDGAIGQAERDEAARQDLVKRQKAHADRVHAARLVVAARARVLSLHTGEFTPYALASRESELAGLRADLAKLESQRPTK